MQTMLAAVNRRLLSRSILQIFGDGGFVGSGSTLGQSILSSSCTSWNDGCSGMRVQFSSIVSSSEEQPENQGHSSGVTSSSGSEMVEEGNSNHDNCTSEIGSVSAVGDDPTNVDNSDDGMKEFNTMKMDGYNVFKRLLEDAEEMPAKSSGSAYESTESEREKALAMLRLHNSMIPNIEGRMIKARILQVDRKSVLLDAGIKHARMAISELTPDCILERSPTRLDGSPRSTYEFVPGDIVQVFLEYAETPDGSMLVSGRQAAVKQRIQAIWQELREYYEKGIAVKGRILNRVNGGYAVGVGGLVCFAPTKSVAPSTARQIGILQDFRIVQMKNKNMNVVLQDFHHRKRSRQ